VHPQWGDSEGNQTTALCPSRIIAESRHLAEICVARQSSTPTEPREPRRWEFDFRESMGKTKRSESQSDSGKFSIERIANLARIDVPQQELASVESDINKILQFVSVFDQLDLSDVEPFFGTIEPDDKTQSLNSLRDDVVVESTSAEKILGNAPDANDGFYQVPKVL
jgi:aspartyl-tRNA(Asn)/glutamyl-tRNA(Gln) amidotransferase subunit C